MLRREPRRDPKPAQDSAQANTQAKGAYVSVEGLLQLRHVAKDLILEANHKSVAMMDGDSRTSFRGRGMEFSEVRPYQAGDDVRNIDWRVTARTQKPYTKLFQEERERPVYILVDQRAPMFFGSVTQFKSVFAAKIAATIAWAALQNNDRIGALIFGDARQTDSRARRGKHSVLGLLHQLVEYNHALESPVALQKDNAMEDMLHDIRRVAKPGSAVFILSDFHDIHRACQEPLAILSRHCDVTAIHIYDELEAKLPANALLSITDGHRKLNLNGQTHAFAHQYQQTFEAQRLLTRKVCHQAGIRFASSHVSGSVTDLVQDLFCARRNSRKRGAHG